MTTPAAEGVAAQWAELDAQDLADSGLGDSGLGDRGLGEPGVEKIAEKTESPRSLVIALGLWCAATLAAVVSVIYAASNQKALESYLRLRYSSGVTVVDQYPKQPDKKVQYLLKSSLDLLTELTIPVLLIATVLLMAVMYPLLARLRRRRSRGARSFLLTFIFLTLISIPIGIDLLFSYGQVPSWIKVIGWVQFGLLVFLGIMVLRREVSEWLPTSMKTTSIRRTHYT